MKRKQAVPCLTMERKELRVMHMRRDFAGLVAAGLASWGPGSRMRIFTLFLYLVGVAGALAQNRMAPLPLLIILYGTGTNSSPVTVIVTHAQGRTENYSKQQSVVTNLSLTCMSVDSVEIKKERLVVSLAVKNVVTYGPGVTDGKYGRDQKLQKAVFQEMSLDVPLSETVQVNGEIFPAARLAEKFGKIPDARKKD